MNERITEQVVVDKIIELPPLGSPFGRAVTAGD